MSASAGLLARGSALARRAPAFLRGELWDFEPEPRTLQSRALWLLRFAVIVAEGFVRDHLLLRASGLAYFTAVSMLPMLAVIVAIAGALGVHQNLAEVAIERFTAVLTDGVEGIGSAEGFRAQLLSYIQGVDFGRLGTLGAVALFVLSVLGIGNIERALNKIWGVTERRPWARRFPDYLAVLIVAPLSLGSALSLGASLESQWMTQRLLQSPIFSAIYDEGLRYAPTLVLAAGFAFLNWFLPNTRVRASAAILAGVATAFLVELAQGLFLRLGVGVARNNALFGSFAALPVLFAWIYTFWAIVLFGAEMAFAYQNLRHYRDEVRAREPGPAEREAIGLRIALEVAAAFRDGRGALQDQALGEGLGVPVRAVRSVLAALSRAAIVAPRGGDAPIGAYQLARPAEDIHVVDVLSALRGERSPELALRDPAVSAALQQLDRSAAEGPGAQSLAALLASGGGQTLASAAEPAR